MKFSYSALDAFRTCPAQYKFQYIDKIKAPKSKEAVFGTLIHDTLKMLHNPSQTLPPTEEEMLHYFTAGWKPEIYENTQEESINFHQGVRILKDYYAKNYPADFNIVDLEVQFSLPLVCRGKTHQINGRIDRIDKIGENRYEILDYKTSKKLPPQKTVDGNLQLSIYYLGIINRWPHLLQENIPVKVSLYFLKHGEKLSTVKTKEHAEEAWEKLRQIVEEMEKSDFPPQPNPLCDWCSYQQHCPYFRHKFVRPQEQDEPIDMKAVAREFYEIKERAQADAKRIKELKALVGRYCDRNSVERIFEEEIVITRLLQTRVSYDEEKMKEILEPLGLWPKVLSFDSKKAAKIIPRLNGDAQKQAEEAKKEKKFYTIGIKKDKKKTAR